MEWERPAVGISIASALLVVLGSVLPWASYSASLASSQALDIGEDKTFTLLTSVIVTGLLLSVLLAPGSFRRRKWVLGAAFLLGLGCFLVCGNDSLTLAQTTGILYGGLLDVRIGLYLGLVGVLGLCAATAAALVLGYLAQAP